MGAAAVAASVAAPAPVAWIAIGSSRPVGISRVAELSAGAPTPAGAAGTDGARGPDGLRRNRYAGGGCGTSGCDTAAAPVGAIVRCTLGGAGATAGWAGRPGDTPRES